MPWVAADAAKHDKKAAGKGSKQWAAVANAVLAKTGNDARAIRSANAVIARRRYGLEPRS